MLERVGLAKLLTPGRSNGLYSMVARIQAMAEAFAGGAGRPEAHAVGGAGEAAFFCSSEATITPDGDQRDQHGADGVDLGRHAERTEL